jgi:methyl-accepting chemotaxis protein
MTSLHVATSSARGSDVSRVSDTLLGGAKQRLGGRDPALVILFASIQKPLSTYQPLVQKAFPKATVLGVSTAGEFTEEGDTQGEVALWAIAGDLAVEARLVEGLKTKKERAVEEAVAGIAPKKSGFAHSTGLIFLDPLAGNAEECTLTASALLGGDIRLVGGAAADNMAMARTEVGLGARAQSDALVLAMLHTHGPVGIGVCHGHMPLSSPLTITRSDNNVVYEVEGRPAWDVWVEHTRAECQALGIDAAKLKEPSDVFDFLNRFEAGLSLGSDYKVRVPLSRGDDGSVHFACGMPQGTVFRIMKSEEERQIQSAGDAIKRSLQNLGAPKAAGALVFDCSCRKTILRNRFNEAVAAMRQALGGAPLAGFETYGEVAMEIGEFSGFHNTTTVAVTFAG